MPTIDDYTRIAPKGEVANFRAKFTRAWRFSDWWIPSPGDEPRLKKWLKGSRYFGLSAMRRRWRRLSKAQQQRVIVLGIGGGLARFLNESGQHVQKEFIRWYAAARWTGAIIFLALWGAPHEAILDAVIFECWGFVPAYCKHKKHRFFRHTVGRRPEACKLHAHAARQARLRAAPSRSRKSLI